MIRTLAFTAALALAGCSSGPLTPSSGIQEATAILSNNQDAISPRFAALAETPRPILQIGLPDAGTSGNMLLEARNGNFEHYLSPDASSITLNRGMLHNLAGFNEGLMATEVSDTLSLVMAGRSGTAERIHSYLGGDDRITFRAYRCRITDLGIEPVQLIDRTVTARLMQESCRNAEQAFTNLYWVDQSRTEIVQSRQWAGPTLGAVSTRRAGLSE